MIAGGVEVAVEISDSLWCYLIEFKSFRSEIRPDMCFDNGSICFISAELDLVLVFVQIFINITHKGLLVLGASGLKILISPYIIIKLRFKQRLIAFSFKTGCNRFELAFAVYCVCKFYIQISLLLFDVCIHSWSPLIESIKIGVGIGYLINKIYNAVFRYYVLTTYS